MNANQLSKNGFYDYTDSTTGKQSQLIVNETIDEHKNKTLEFVNKEGQVVLKKVQESDNSFLSTYYVYDDFGNLRYVLPPKAVEELQTNSWFVNQKVKRPLVLLSI